MEEKKKTTKKSSTTKTSAKPKTSTKKVGTKTNNKTIKPKVKEEVVKKEVETSNKKISVLEQAKKVNNDEMINRIIYSVIAITLILILIITIISKFVKVSPKLKDGSQLVASLDGKNITTDELYERIKKQYGTSYLVDIVDSYIADKEIEDSEEANEYAKSQLEALKANYEANGYDFAADLKQAGYANEQELINEMISKYKKDKAVIKFVQNEITENEIKEYYEANIFGSITAKHILITPKVSSEMTDEEKAAAENEALNKAKSAIERLNNGESFDDLVKELSDDEGSKENAGLISNFTKTGSTAVVEEFWNAAYNLENGSYTKSPVQTKFGYHVILRISNEERPSLDSVTEEIKETLANERLQSNENESVIAWSRLREKYNLNIVDTHIKDSYNSIIDSYKKQAN